MNITQSIFMDQINGKYPLFEIEVNNKETQEKDYITFDISVQEGYFVAQRVPFNIEEQNSNKIATTKTVIDNDFSLDSNLEELYSACIQDIIDSDFYDLRD